MTKVISLSNEAYSTLKRIKGRDSFSKAVLATLGPKKENLFELFGKWPGSHEELRKIETAIAQDRKKFRLKEVNF